jgi:hypothetical protein
MKKAFSVVILMLLALPAFAETQSVAARRGVSSAQPRQFAQPPLRQASSAATVLQRLPKLEAYEVASLKYANGSGGAMRIGVVRSLEHEIAVRPSPGVTAASTEPWTWRGAIAVDGGYGLRAQLTGVDLPAEAELWVYGTDGVAIGFDASAAFEGTIWTPTVEGDAITIEVRSPRAGSFAIAAIADLRPEGEVSANATECFKDVACQSSTFTDSATAIGQYSFISGGSAFVCSGGLILDVGETFAPYFLTAHHCVSTASEAASLDVAWDYRAASCNATPPTRASRPKTLGASLLATSANSDVTLLRLSSVPGSRFWLGWATSPVPAGSTLYRVSHPNGGPQVFSTTVAETLLGACTELPRPRFLYETRTVGSVAGGSSGAPVIYSNGQIVGQLLGACGSHLENPCDVLDRTVDGAFSSSYAVVQPIINPGTNTAACTPSAAKLCLNGNRFELTVNWSTNDNRTGAGTAVSMTNDTGYFWFFGSSNVELVIKVLDGRPVNGKFWVFYGALSNVGYTLTVRDTQTGAVKTYVNPINTLASVADTSAF